MDLSPNEPSGVYYTDTRSYSPPKDFLLPSDSLNYSGYPPTGARAKLPYLWSAWSAKYPFRYYNSAPRMPTFVRINHTIKANIEPKDTTKKRPKGSFQQLPPIEGPGSLLPLPFDPDWRTPAEKIRAKGYQGLTIDTEPLETERMPPSYAKTLFVGEPAPKLPFRPWKPLMGPFTASGTVSGMVLGNPYWTSGSGELP
jgi:hypothetical protein